MRERGTLVTSMVLLSVLAAGSYWLAVRARLLDAVARPTSHEVDYYAENFQLTRMDKDGKPNYRLEAGHLLHFADDDSTKLKQPTLVTLAPDKPPVNLTAKDGEVSSGGDIVKLYGDVQMVRAATADDPALTATASRMTIWPDDDIARTDVPVHAVHGRSTMDGDTMYFSNTDRVLKLDDDVPAGRTHVTIEPHIKPTTKTAAAK